MWIRTKCVPVEAHQSVGIIERVHSPLRRAFEVIRDDLQKAGSAVPKAAILQMAVKAVNNTSGPDALVPTLLVFGAYPRISALDPPTATIAQRTRAIQKGKIEVERIYARK